MAAMWHPITKADYFFISEVTVSVQQTQTQQETTDTDVSKSASTGCANKKQSLR